MNKKPLLPFQFWDQQSLGADATSSVTDIRYQDNITFQLNVTGSPVGQFIVQGCDDYSAAPFGSLIDAGTWVDIVTADVNGADQIIFDGNQIGFHYIRIFYDRTSGTGAVDGYVTGKQV